MARALFAAALCCRCSAAAAAASMHLLGIKPTALRLSRTAQQQQAGHCAALTARASGTRERASERSLARLRFACATHSRNAHA
eukprot:scaffold27038_cov124-Isochrysis_galbana.AAC.1